MAFTLMAFANTGSVVIDLHTTNVISLYLRQPVRLRH